MEVTTTSPRLDSYRKMIVELLFTERNHICSVCVSNGHCELQSWPRSWTSPRSLSLPLSRRREWMHRTTVSCLTTTAASCVRAAFGCAMKSRAPTPGTSWAVASIRGSSPISTNPGVRRKPAPGAANASRFVLQARCPRGPFRGGDGKTPKLPAVPDPDARGTRVSKKRLATVWLDGCSGCHMSFLDMDERLIALAAKADLVYSPLVDAKISPRTWTSPWWKARSAARKTCTKLRLVRAAHQDSGFAG